MPDEAGTTVPPEPGRSSNGTATTEAEAEVVEALAHEFQGDVHVGSMAGDVRRVPGSGTENGERALADYMREVLDRVRRSIRERTSSRR